MRQRQGWKKKEGNREWEKSVNLRKSEREEEQREIER